MRHIAHRGQMGHFVQFAVVLLLLLLLLLRKNSINFRPANVTYVDRGQSDSGEMAFIFL